MVPLSSERVSLRIGRVTFKIPCFGDLIAGSVASVAGSPCPIRSKGRISSNALCRGYCATIYRTHLLKACLFEHPAKHMPQRSSKSDESKIKRIALSSKGRLINRRLVHQAQFRERADLEDGAPL
jgi:hypothetical protein